MSEKDSTTPETTPSEDLTAEVIDAPAAASESAESATDVQAEGPAADASDAPAENGSAEGTPAEGEPEFIVDPFDPFNIPSELAPLILEKVEEEIKSKPARRRSERSDQASDSDETVSRRRRRRRRGDEDIELIGGDDEDPPNTITRVRVPRAVAEGTGADQVTAVKGSTRLEAKRQRRRDSRDSGRRRTVITEAEFLARRESVERKMIVREREDRIQIGVLEDGILAEHFVSNTQQDSLIGNVYVGKVQNVLPSMEAAFVDIGRGRNAVLYAGEVNWDTVKLDGKPRRIENALKGGDTVLVQVSKDPVGHKGARLTSQISLPGRYLVYVPDGSMTGISRKLPDVERARLKKILKDHLPADAGVIVRTAAEGASEEELTNDINRLRVQWEGIKEKANSNKTLAPELLYAEPDLTIKVVRDVFNEDFSKLIVSGENTWDQIEAYVTYVAPDLVGRLERWESDDDIFSHFRIDEQINKALDRKVFLPSGGSLVIDRTEAMTVVDVNTGKFTGSGGNLEETVTKNNLEAAEEVVRQLRLRDIGGIIVIDFIDMVLESNRDLVLRRLVECLGRDRTKHQVAEVTSLGLVQMTRKRMGTGLLEVFGELCPECAGRGMVTHEEPILHRRPLAPVPSSAKAEGRGGRGERRRRKPRHGEAGYEADQQSQISADQPDAASGPDEAEQRSASSHAKRGPQSSDAVKAVEPDGDVEQAVVEAVEAADEQERFEDPQTAAIRDERSGRRSDRGERPARGGRGRGRGNGRGQSDEQPGSEGRGESEAPSQSEGRPQADGRSQSEGRSQGGERRQSTGRGQSSDRSQSKERSQSGERGQSSERSQSGRGGQSGATRGGRSGGRRGMVIETVLPGGGQRLPSGALAPKGESAQSGETPVLDFGDAKVELPRGTRRTARAPQTQLKDLEQVFDSTTPAARDAKGGKSGGRGSKAVETPRTGGAGSEESSRGRKTPAAAPSSAPAAQAPEAQAPAAPKSRRVRRVASSPQGTNDVTVSERPLEAEPAKTFSASAKDAKASAAATSAQAPVMLGVGVSAEEIARAGKN